MDKVLTAIKTIFRILAYRATREEIERNTAVIALVSLVFTIIVGIGRWWDDPRDLPPAIRMGLGSAGYVILMAAVITVISYPLARHRIGYLGILAFVGATSVPGIVYALPIESISPTAQATTYNLTALIFVAIYRVSLLGWFLMSILGMNGWRSIVVTFLPISTITLVLTMSGFGGRVLDIMGGFREQLPKSAVEEVISAIGCNSCLLVPILFIAYIRMAMVAAAERVDDESQKKRARPGESSEYLERYIDPSDQKQD